MFCQARLVFIGARDAGSAMSIVPTIKRNPAAAFAGPIFSRVVENFWRANVLWLGPAKNKVSTGLVHRSGEGENCTSRLEEDLAPCLLEVPAPGYTCQITRLWKPLAARTVDAMKVALQKTIGRPLFVIDLEKQVFRLREAGITSPVTILTSNR